MNMKLRNKQRRLLRVRSKIKLRSSGKFRVSVFRSNKHLYAQLIDDVQGVTLVHVSTLLPEIREIMGGKLNRSAGKIIGEMFVKKCSNVSSSGMVFDRGSYSYTGVISEFADTVRALGLKI